MRAWWAWLILAVVALVIPASLLWSDELWIHVVALAVFLAVGGALTYVEKRLAQR